MNARCLPIEPVQARLFADAQAAALDRLDHCAAVWGSRFPDDTTVGGRYLPRSLAGHPPGANVGWTTGFWTGLGWLAYELSGRAPFCDWVLAQQDGYARRVSQRIDLDHHDLGFLFGPWVAVFRKDGDPAHRALALQAAAVLAGRYLPQAGVIQAWGRMGDPGDRRNQGRIIIDTLMNLPLLYWAGAQSGEACYGAVATSHLARTLELLVRDDGSSAHSCHVDPASGKLLAVSTVQGHASDSCWSRGQAWAIYGCALNHPHAPGAGLLGIAQRLAGYLLARLPADGVCQWDLAFGAQGAVQRDSSASAIAACGLLELASQLEAADHGTSGAAARYRQAALHMLEGLVRTCAAPPGGDGLLLHGVYSLPEGRGVDEANLWGDYYYLEALARVNAGWRSYWHASAGE